MGVSLKHSGAFSLCSLKQRSLEECVTVLCDMLICRFFPGVIVERC